VKWVKVVAYIKIAALWVIVAVCFTLLFQARVTAQSGRLRLAEGLIGAVGLIAVFGSAVMHQRKRWRSQPRG